MITIPLHFKAALFMLCGSVSFVLAMTFAKFLSPHISMVMLIFFRISFGFVFTAPVIFSQGFSDLKTKLMPLHILRGCFMALAMVSTYYGYRNLTLPLATTIGFTGPFIVGALSYFFFKDEMPLLKVCAIITGYLGVVILAAPSDIHTSNAFWVAIAGNVFASIAIIILKFLTRTESTKIILLYSNCTMLVIGSMLASFYWQTPDYENLLRLLIVGGFGAYSQFFYIKALQCAEASYVAPFEYTRLVMFVPISAYVFHETIAPSTILGSAIIIFSAMALIFLQRNKPV